MLTPDGSSEAARPIPDSISQSQPAGPKAVGAMLHARREDLGRDLRAAADTLRIRYPYLQAIEEGRVEDLPGPTYAVGFVRAYADYLGLDGEYIVARFKLENERLEQHRAQLVFPSPASETRIPSGAILLIAIALAVAAYGGWVYLSSSERNIADMVPSLPDNLTALLRSDPSPQPATPSSTPETTASQPEAPSQAPAAAAPELVPPATPAPMAPVAAAPPAAAPPAATPPVAAPVPPSAPAPAPTSAVPPPLVAPVAPVAPAAPPAAASTSGQEPAPDSAPEPPGPVNPNATIPDSPPLPAVAAAAPPRPDVVLDSELRPEARVYGEENTGARVLIRALSDSWVEVRDERSGELLLTRVLRTGDTYRVPDRSGLSLVTGNAGGIEIFLDGKPVGSIGPLGSVRRNLPLDPDSLRRMSAAN